MKLRSAMKGAGLVAACALLTAAIWLMGLLAFIYTAESAGRGWGASMEQISGALAFTGGGYAFTGADLLEAEDWAMLLDEEGRVAWSWRYPEELPKSYTLCDVAAFTRWYLEDYPVRCWVREDGLLVVGGPKDSMWKHDIALDSQTLRQVPAWLAALFIASLGCALALAHALLGRWFRKAQRVRDAARAGWINGISHDIRTPLSMVMGYAAQMEGAADLPPQRRKQAGIIRAQSQAIRDLVNDLNLTMRLDWAMQPLRRERLQPAAFLRQTAADFFNSGMGEGFSLDMDLPPQGLAEIWADPFLLRRALNNLLTNAVRHNAPGCRLAMGAREEKGQVIFWVEGGRAAEELGRPDPDCWPLGADGGAAHGTGLKLVAQIAAAHGGAAKFLAGTPFRCELRLPRSAAHPAVPHPDKGNPESVGGRRAPAQRKRD